MISGLFTYQTGRFLKRALKQFCGKRKISPTKEMETNYYSYRKENEKFDPNFTPLKKKTKKTEMIHRLKWHKKYARIKQIVCNFGRGWDF